MELLVMVILLLIVVAFQFIAIPYCLMVVLGLFGFSVGFISCLALVVLVRAIVFLIRGN